MANTRAARTKPAPQEDIENQTPDRETDDSQPASSQRVRLPSARQREILADRDMNASSSPSRTRAVKSKLNAAKSKTKPKRMPPKTIPKSKSLSQKKYFEDDEEDSEAEEEKKEQEERKFAFEKEAEEKRRVARELLMERLDRQQERDTVEKDRVAADFEADKSMLQEEQNKKKKKLSAEKQKKIEERLAALETEKVSILIGSSSDGSLSDMEDDMVMDFEKEFGGGNGNGIENKSGSGSQVVQKVRPERIVPSGSQQGVEEGSLFMPETLRDIQKTSSKGKEKATGSESELEREETIPAEESQGNENPNEELEVDGDAVANIFDNAVRKYNCKKQLGAPDRTNSKSKALSVARFFENPSQLDFSLEDLRAQELPVSLKSPVLLSAL